EGLQPTGKVAQSLEAFPDPAQVQLHDLEGRQPTVIQTSPDLLEGEAELAKGEDLLEPGYVLPGVQPVPGLAARRGREQPDLVVVVQRAHRDARPSGQLADLPVLHGIRSVRA